MVADPRRELESGEVFVIVRLYETRVCRAQLVVGVMVAV